MKKHRILTIVFILLLLTLSASAQKTDVRVDGKKIYDIIDYMASDQFLGRKPNTPEFFLIQDWVVKQYKAWGLEPAGENGTFYQAVPISRNYTVDYGTPRLIINGREFFIRFGDFRIDSRSTIGKKIRGDVVFAGYGISAPEKGLDEYADLDVAGNIVLLLKGNPGDFDPPRDRFAAREGQGEDEEEVTEDWKKESADSTKIKTAYSKGAAGIIFYNPEPETNRFMRRFRAQVEASPFQRDFIVVSQVSEKVFQWILWTDPQMSSRGFTTWMNSVRGDIRGKKARSFDTKMKAEIAGFEKTLLKGKKFEDDKGRNIIAKIIGTDPVLKDQYVVMGGHFDHLGVTNGQIFNGAESFGYNIHLMQIAKDILDFGRIDMPGEDGVWFDQGLTEQGAAALDAMEKKGLVLHLMNSSKATLTAVLEKAKKPFLVSGFSELDDEMITQINEKKVLIGVDFDPQNIESTLILLDKYKEKFGDTDNFLLNVTSKTGLDETKKSLYMHLIEKGWEHKDIYAIGGAGATRRSRGNLDPFMPRRRMPSPGMR